MEHENKIECLECGYIGEPDIEWEGSEGGLWWCPECGSLYIMVIDEEVQDEEI